MTVDTGGAALGEMLYSLTINPVITSYDDLFPKVKILHRAADGSIKALLDPEAVKGVVIVGDKVFAKITEAGTYFPARVANDDDLSADNCDCSANGVCVAGACVTSGYENADVERVPFITEQKTS